MELLNQMDGFDSLGQVIIYFNFNKEHVKSQICGNIDQALVVTFCLNHGPFPKYLLQLL